MNRIFISRPDISFRVYGGADKTSGYEDDFNGWNLDFLRFVPDVQNIEIGRFEYKNTDLSILSRLSNLKSLILDIYNLRDFFFHQNAVRPVRASVYRCGFEEWQTCV